MRSQKYNGNVRGVLGEFQLFGSLGRQMTVASIDLFCLVFFQLKQKIKQEVVAENYQRMANEKPSDHIGYGLGKGALIPKVFNRSIDKWKNKR